MSGRLGDASLIGFPGESFRAPISGSQHGQWARPFHGWPLKSPLEGRRSLGLFLGLPEMGGSPNLLEFS